MRYTRDLLTSTTNAAISRSYSMKSPFDRRRQDKDDVEGSLDLKEKPRTAAQNSLLVVSGIDPDFTGRFSLPSYPSFSRSY